MKRITPIFILSWLAQAVPGSPALADPGGAAPGERRAPVAAPLPVLRKAVGVLGAGFCFQTYEAVSATGQALALGRKPSPAAIKRLRGIAATTQMVRRSLSQVQALGLGGSDQLAVMQMREALGPLRSAALTLVRYARKPSRKRFIAFENDRQLAWRKLKALFAK